MCLVIISVFQETAYDSDRQEVDSNWSDAVQTAVLDLGSFRALAAAKIFLVFKPLHYEDYKPPVGSCTSLEECDGTFTL